MKPLQNTLTAEAYPIIRRLIWLYFWLLIFEGALRKWILPSAATYLLLIRVPVALAIYVLAIKDRIFKFSLTMFVGLWIGIFSLIVGGIALGDAPAVVLFGFQANFLQLPLIYIISRVFHIEDVKRIGYCVLILSIPLTLLCVMQFRSSAHSIWNAAAGQEGMQISSTGGHVRASATFSFIVGAIYFYCLVAAYMAYAYLVNKTYPRLLLMIAAPTLIVGPLCCASRGLIAMLAIVFSFVVISGVFVNRKYFAKTILLVISFVFMIALIAQAAIVQDSFQVFSQRITNADRSEGGVEGTANARILSMVTRPAELIYNGDVPLFGNGLGIGTIGGAKLQNGSIGFFNGRDSEIEWSRHIVESGPILGTAFIFLRIAIAIQVLIPAFRSARQGNLLPLILAGVSTWPLLNEKLGQASALGFIVLVSGLSLAANRIPRPVVNEWVKAKNV